MMLRRFSPARQGVIAVAFVAAFFIGVAGCSKPPPAAPPPIPQVMVTNVVREDVPVYSSWVGTTLGFVNAEIHPKISGYILKQVYQDGDHVRAGQLLFQIDDRQYKAAFDQAAGDLAEKLAELKRNQQDLARYKPLLAAQVISRQDYDHVNQTTHASVAAVQAAQAAVEGAKLNLDWTRVTSPIDGVAGIAKTQVGDLVSPPTLLTTVSQLDPIKVTFPISEREYLHFAEKIKEHQENGVAKGEPTLEMILADGSVYPYRATSISPIGKSTFRPGRSRSRGSFLTTTIFCGPGLYAKIRSATDVLPNALLVPQRAILETQGQYQVAVVGADNRVSLHTVKPGKTYGDLRIIEEGIAPGERVITEGVQKVTTEWRSGR